MPVRVDLSSNSSVRLLCVDEDDTACAYMANLYIPVFSLTTGNVIRRYEVPNQIVGLHMNHKKQNILYAVDDSFGLHIFDIRSDSKHKKRLNPEAENHNVICTALSSNNTLAVASSEFGGGILDVRGSRRREHRPHVVTLFDIRQPGEPLTTYHKRHKAEVCAMEFYKNGNDLLTGDVNGALKSFNTACRDEDNAIRWERWAKGPITKVGIINKRIVYGVSARSEVTVFVDSKGELEVLYGSVAESADQPIPKTSKAFYKKPEWCVGLMKGINDEIPLVAVHGVQNETFLSLTAMTQAGIRQEKPLLSYEGHTGEVKCMLVTPKLLLTGGEDGRVIIQHADFKSPEFGNDGIPHHRLTLNRGDLADRHDKGEDEDESEAAAPGAKDSSESSDDSSDSDADDAAPSTSKLSSRGPNSSSYQTPTKPAVKSTPKAAAAPSTSVQSSSSSKSASKVSSSSSKPSSSSSKQSSSSSKPSSSSSKPSSSSASSSKKKKKADTTDDDSDDDTPRRPPVKKEKKLSPRMLTADEMRAKRQEELKYKEAKARANEARELADETGWEEITDPEEIKKAEEEERLRAQAEPVKPKVKKTESSRRTLQDRARIEFEEKQKRLMAEYEAFEAARNNPANRLEKEDKEAKRQANLAEKARKAAEEKRLAEEREARRQMKLKETKEERAARKDRERAERDRLDRERAERKKAQNEQLKEKKEGTSSSGSSSSKKHKHK